MTGTQGESVIVCMPVYDKVHPLAWLADMELMVSLARRFKPEKLAIINVRKLTQPHAQNVMCNHANDMRQPDGKPFDWLLWIEDDTTPPPNAFDLLREQAHPEYRPIVHAISFDRQDDLDPSIWTGSEPTEKGEVYIRPIRQWKPDTLYRIVHSGTCCSLFHMSIWDKLKKPWFRMQPFDSSMGVGLAPCQSLSQRIYEAKIPMYGYTGCVVGHIGDEVVIGAEESRLKQRQNEVAPDGGIKRFI